MSLQTDHAREKPVLSIFWTPERFFAKYDIRKLVELEFDGYAMESRNDDPNCNSDGCWDMIPVGRRNETYSKEICNG